MTTTEPRLLTPSKLTAWLDCAHFLTLQHEVDDGRRPEPTGTLGALARLLMQKGLDHELACLEELQKTRGPVVSLPTRNEHESFASLVERTGDILPLGHDVLYQMPFIHDGMRGIADFLLKKTLPDGQFTYEPVDAKLARTEAKPGHVLQLCFYADAIEARLGIAPEFIHLWLGSGTIESIRLSDVRAYWRRLRTQLTVVLAASDEAAATKSVPCSHCTYCSFADTCDDEWRRADALQFTAGIRVGDREKLEAARVTTLAKLAVIDTPVPDLKPERQARLVKQASLQAIARRHADDVAPPFERLEPESVEERAKGLAALPAPDDGDVFLDYEGHPFWRADTGLFFLFGLLTKAADGRWVYEARWAHDKPDEGAQAKALIEYFAARRTVHPGMHVYHYNHTERSALEAMAAEHAATETGAAETLLGTLVGEGLFVDLLPIVRNAIIAGVESYGLKSMEQLAGYARSHDIDAGASAVVEYERYTKGERSDPEKILPRIALYNEDDVRATLALRDWLIGLRNPGDTWRVAVLPDEEPRLPNVDAQIAALTLFDVDTPQRLMGDCLGYWHREWKKHAADLLAKLATDPTRLYDDPAAIVGLTLVGRRERTRKGSDKPINQALDFTFTPKPLDRAFTSTKSAQVVFSGADGFLGFASVDTCDPNLGTLTLLWSDKMRDLGVVPSTIVLNDWVKPDPKPEALSHLAGLMLADDGSFPRVASALLSREPPRFLPGTGPRGGRFTGAVDDAKGWVAHLDGACVPIQGPPGTGKTYTGAHLIHALVKAEKRVGVTSLSHAAIDNLLKQTLLVFEQAGDLSLLKGARYGATKTTPESPQLECPSKLATCADPKFNVVAGTSWFFANKAMRENPVDVLIIDEAGQLALADALATTGSAHNLILLGDPLQLAQVSLASHPNGSGASVLEHVLAGHATVKDDRGVFLSETRRMHPDVCTFISSHIYESRLTAHETCATQRTAHGTGLRFLRAEHAGCSKESPEEARLVVDEIAHMMGSDWTDQHGTTRPLVASDFMVVAPYNDQVRLIARALDDDPRTTGVPVGTVDKFQGQEAAVVFFSMTTSTAAEMPRDSKFLFSRNRLNVALSRARCLAFVVCTEALLNSRAKDLDDMRLISTVCAAIEHARVRRLSS
jgi:predicted RecB family nuclease